MIIDPTIVDAIAKLDPRATDWRRQLLARLHDEALFEALLRRGGPRTAREYSARDWYLARRDPAIIAAAEAAYAHHKMTAPTPKPRVRRRSLSALYASAVRASTSSP